MTRASTWTNADGLIVGFGTNAIDFDSVGAVLFNSNEKELTFVIDGEKFSGGVYQFVTTEALPVGASPVSASVRVSEVFVLGGTTPTIQIGTSGSGAAAVFGSLSEANAEALGTYLLSPTTTPLTSTTAGNLRVSLGGTTPTVTAAGRATVTVTYRINPAK
jgi:hypothetical protein